MHMNIHELPALLISFEGIDGCGKSTLLAQLSSWLDREEVGHIKTREPGGTPLGETIRTILLDSSRRDMETWAEALLYAASRAQLVRELIRPALNQGLWVLADRYADATLAYQGYGRGLDLERLAAIHKWSTEAVWPDCTVLLDCSVETACRRRSNRGCEPDRLEQQERSFHERVAAGYLKLAAEAPQRFLVLDANRPLTQVIDEFRLLFWTRFGLGA